MKDPTKYNLKIIIEGKQGHGKTTAARAIRTLLEGMGAWATIKDEGEITWPDKSPSQTPPRGTDYLLGDTGVGIFTKYLEDD
jgi:hypothetical protein